MKQHYRKCCHFVEGVGRPPSLFLGTLCRLARSPELPSVRNAVVRISPRARVCGELAFTLATVPCLEDGLTLGDSREVDRYRDGWAYLWSRQCLAAAGTGSTGSHVLWYGNLIVKSPMKDSSESLCWLMIPLVKKSSPSVRSQSKKTAEERAPVRTK